MPPVDELLVPATARVARPSREPEVAASADELRAANEALLAENVQLRRAVAWMRQQLQSEGAENAARLDQPSVEPPALLSCRRQVQRLMNEREALFECCNALRGRLRVLESRLSSCEPPSLQLLPSYDELDGADGLLQHDSLARTGGGRAAPQSAAVPKKAARDEAPGEADPLPLHLAAESAPVLPRARPATAGASGRQTQSQRDVAASLQRQRRRLARLGASEAALVGRVRNWAVRNDEEKRADTVAA